MNKPTTEDLARAVRKALDRICDRVKNYNMTWSDCDREIWKVRDLCAVILDTPDQPELASLTVAEMRKHASQEYSIGHTSLAKCMKRWADALESAQRDRDQAHQIMVDTSNLHAAAIEAMRAELAKHRDDAKYNVECYQQRVAELESETKAQRNEIFHLRALVAELRQAQQLQPSGVEGKPDDNTP